MPGERPPRAALQSFECGERAAASRVTGGQCGVVQVGMPPRFDPMEEQSSRVGRLLGDQLFQALSTAR